VAFTLREGEILGLIGPNGAGKTTLLNALSGFQPLTRGKISIASRDVTGWPPRRLVRRGLARTFQGVRVFRALSVLENVELGAVGLGWSRGRARALAFDLLARMDLTSRAHVMADSLPYGEERRLGILRALATQPRFLLMDEPAAGLNDAESRHLVQVIRDIRRDYGCGVLVIEHDMPLVMGLCEKIHVLDYGKTISIGTPGEVQADPAVITAYLGTKGQIPFARN
jgi:branched-chain amino acid transport system ATP-binding protein